MKTLGTFGADRSLSQINGAPQISSAFMGWTSTLLLVRISQTIVDGLVDDSADQIPFQGVVQPLSPKQLVLKPEGERAWAWLQIHVQNSSPVKLDVNDRIMYNCRKYKVMAQSDWSANGYMEYHVVADYDNNSI